MKAKSSSKTDLTRGQNDKQKAEQSVYLASLLDQISDALISTDMDFRVLEWNATAENIYGWKSAEVIGKPLGEIVQNEYIDTTREAVIKSVLEERIWKGEVTQNRKDGTRFPVLASVSLIKDQAGKPMGFVAVNHDITTRKLAEEILRENNSTLELAMQSANMAWWEMNIATGKVTFDKRKAEMLGYPPEKFKHYHDFMALVHPEDSEKAMSAMQRHIDGISDKYEVEYRISAKSGEYKWFYDIGSVVKRDSQGIPLNATGLVIDITGRKLAEARVLQLNRLYSTLSQINQAIVRTHDRENLFNEICRVAIDLGKYRMAWIGLVNETTCVVEPFVFAGEEQGYLSNVQIKHLDEELGRGPTGTSIREGRCVICQDIATDPVMKPWREQALKRGYRSSASVPFWVKGHAIGSLTVYAEDPHTFDLESEKLLHEIGENISFALDTMETEARRKLAEQALRIKDQAISSSLNAIATADLAGTLTYINAAFLHAWGYDHESEVLGKPAVQFWQQEEKAAEIIKALQTQSGWIGELTAKRKNDMLFDVQLTANFLKDEFGKPVGMVAAFINITERKRAEAQIQRQLRQLNGLRIIDQAISGNLNMPETLNIIVQQSIEQLSVDAAAILLIDDQRQWFECAASQGFRSEEVHRTRLKLSEAYAGRAARERQTIHISNLLESNSSLAESLKTAGDDQLDYYSTPLMVKDEVLGVLEIYARVPINPDDDWLAFFVMIAGQAAIAIDNAQLFDSLQRSNAELEGRVQERTADLLRLNAELKHANRAKDEFLANMSHELRTPLNSILGLTESIQLGTYGQPNEKQVEALKTVEASGRHLLELINDILDLSKIEAGKFEIFPEMVNLNDACRASLYFIKEQAQKKLIAVTYQPAADVVFITADPRRLKQMLVNLLSNAVKFTPEQGQVTLAVNVGPEKGQIHISVADTGIGIAREDLDHLFTPFTQVDSHLNRQYEGTGLGLVLVLSLAEMHGGNVQVESEVGKGSRFTLSLPWKPQSLTLTEIPNHQVQIHTPEEAAPNSRGVLLLAEDNAANIEVVADYLKFKGYTLVIASNGVEALLKAEEFNPRLILMDIQMPVMDGLEATRRLRADPRFVSTPIIALTALAMTGDRERCHEAGANDFLSKPVSLKELLERIENLLKQDQQNRPK